MPINVCAQCGKQFQARLTKQKFCSSDCYHISHRGEHNWNYKGGSTEKGRCYVTFAGVTRLRSRVVMEQKLGRPLLSHEHVHHINHDKLDDRPENLTLLVNSEHSRLHSRERPRTLRTDTHKECTKCREVKPRTEFHRNHRRDQIEHDPHRSQCKSCRAAREGARRFPARPCSVCGRSFQPHRRGGHVCSKSCASLCYWRDRQTRH